MAEKRKTKAQQLQAQLNQAEAQSQLYLNAYLQSRRGLAAALGQSFDGDRDLYEALGYKKEPVFADYLNFYERDGIATRVVDAIADETWRNHPILTDEKSETPDEENPSPLHIKFEDMADRLDLWAKFNEIDRSCGISRFGLMYLGLPMKVGESAQDPVNGKNDILYVTVHDEGDASVDEMNLVADANNPRFGMPEYYNIDIGANGEQMRVHYSRVIHVKEGKERSQYSRFYGVPRLKRILNRLYDLEKVIGGGSEAFWLLIYRGMAMMAKEGFSLPPKDSDEYKDMQSEIEEYMHGLRRYMRLQGMDVEDLGGQPVDSREQFDVIIAYIAGAQRYPQRLLIGSEQGKLASTQDDANFGDYVSWRRENHAEPYILRPFLRKAAELEQLEARPRYYAYWPSPFQLNDLEEADVAVKMATAANQASGGAPETIIPADEFAKRLPGKWKYIWTPDKIAEIAEQNEPELVQSNPFGENGNNPNGENLIEPVLSDNGKFSANRLDLNKIKRAIKRAFGSKPDEDEIMPVYRDEFPTVLEKGAWFSTTYGPVLFHNENEHSVMIALRIPDELRLELQQTYPIMSDETRDNLHITLAFLGDSRTLDLKKIAWAMADFTEKVKPIKTQMQGVARFVSGNEQDPIVATIDSPDLPAFRQTLTDALDAHGIPYHKEHGFLPHMTLAYIPKDAPMPLDTIEPLEMNFSEVYLAVGGQWIAFQLGEERQKDENPFIQFGERLG